MGRPRHERSIIWSFQTTQSKRSYASDPVGSSSHRTRTSDAVEREVRDTKSGTTVCSSSFNADDPSRFVATSPHWVLSQCSLHGEAVSCHGCIGEHCRWFGARPVEQGLFVLTHLTTHSSTTYSAKCQK